MGLEAQNRIAQAIGGAVRDISRIVFVKRLVTAGVAAIQAFGHGDPDDPDNQELLQEIDVDHIQHFGFESFPGVDGETEGIKVDADGGEACIAERRVLPSGLAALVVNESRTYGEDGQSILHKTGGDIEAEPKAGKHMKVGATATEFAALANLVLSELQQIKTDFDVHVHLAGALVDSSPAPCTGSTAGPFLAMTAPGSVECTKLKIE